jgi:hypothetical protein
MTVKFARIGFTLQQWKKYENGNRLRHCPGHRSQP